MFCERCGTRQPAPPPDPHTPGVLARKLLDVTGFTTADRPSRMGDDYLRLCLTCREYSCPTCWNDEVGVCQSCAPLPEPVVVWVAPESEPEPVVVYANPVAEPEPIFVAEAEPLAEPEPVFVAEAEPAPLSEPEPTRPALPRMPIIPLPRSRRPESELPLPPMFDFQVPPQIHFERMNAGRVTEPEFPAYAALPVPARAVAGPASVRPCHNCQPERLGQGALLPPLRHRPGGLGRGKDALLACSFSRSRRTRRPRGPVEQDLVAEVQPNQRAETVAITPKPAMPPISSGASRLNRFVSSPMPTSGGDAGQKAARRLGGAVGTTVNGEHDRSTIAERARAARRSARCQLADELVEQRPTRCPARSCPR